MNARVKNCIGWAFVVAFLVSLWLWFLPPQLGGRTMFVTTHGTSMEPLLHSNDLAVLQRQSQYNVGDIIEYHSDNLNAPILHRIVSIDYVGISTKGDNNDFVDLDHPTQKEIYGKLIHRYAGAGKYASWVKSTPARVIGALLIGIAVYAMIVQDPKKRSERSRLRKLCKIPTGSGNESEAPALPRMGLRHLAPLTLFALILAVSIFTSAAGFAKPIGSSKPSITLYNVIGKFGYSGAATGGDLVYSDGQVSTGDPIYLAMLHQIFVTFNFEISSPSRFKGGGSVQMEAVVSGKSGWTHTIPIGAEQEFTGSKTRGTATIDFNQMRDLQQQIDRFTKINDGGFTVAVHPVVKVDGTLGGGPLNTTFAPQLNFDVSPAQAIVEKGSGGLPAAPGGKTAAPTSSGISTSSGGTVTIPKGIPAHLKGLGVAIGIATLRTVGVVGLLVGTAGVGLILFGRRRAERAKLNEFDIERKNCDELLVPVSGWGVAGQSMIIDVPSLTDLARLAEQMSCLILHEQGANETFVVNNGNLTYRYLRPAPSAEARFGTVDTTVDADIDVEAQPAAGANA